MRPDLNPATLSPDDRFRKLASIRAAGRSVWPGHGRVPITYGRPAVRRVMGPKDPFQG